MSGNALTVQNNDALITVKQLPVIEQRLEQLKPEIQAAVEKALALPVTEDTVKEIKKLRAALRSRFEALEKERKRIKDIITAPYEKMLVTYSDCVSAPLKAADATLKERIDEVEDGILAPRVAEVKAYFEEYAANLGLTDIPYEAAGINMILSLTVTKAKEQAKEWLDKRATDMSAISAFDNQAEIAAEYRANGYDFAKAVQTVSDRNKAIEKEKAKQAEREAVQKQQEEAAAKVERVIAPPVVTQPDESETVTVSFTVTATRRQIRALREYMKEAGIKYE